VGDRSTIEWTEATWNPTTGCDRISRGCDNCYALALAKRLKAMGAEKYQADGDPRTSGPGFALTVHPSALAIPYGWKTPRTVFIHAEGSVALCGVRVIVLHQRRRGDGRELQCRSVDSLRHAGRRPRQTPCLKFVPAAAARYVAWRSAPRTLILAGSLAWVGTICSPTHLHE
jgi:hypothetical protein